MPSSRAKTIGWVAACVTVILALEWAGLIWFARRPTPLDTTHANPPRAAANPFVEVPVTRGVFTNAAAGAGRSYELAVVITIARDRLDAHGAAAIRQLILDRQSEFDGAVAHVIRNAHPQWFGEARLPTLRRLLKAKLRDLLPGADAQAHIVHEVYVPTLRPATETSS